MESLAQRSAFAENMLKLHKVGRGIRPAIPYAALLIMWQLVTARIPSYLLPTPYQTFAASLSLFNEGELQNQVGVTLYHLIGGVLLSAISGIVLGLAVGLFKTVRDLWAPTVPFFQSVPGLCWAFIALVWFGLSPVGVVFVVFMGTFPNMLLNVWEGTKNVDRALIQMATVFGCSRWQLIQTIYLPGIFPYIIAGIRIIVGLGWKTVVVAEMLLGGEGIGAALYNSAYSLRIDLVFSWTLVLVVLMSATEYSILGPLERRIVQWKAT